MEAARKALTAKRAKEWQMFFPNFADLLRALGGSLPSLLHADHCYSRVKVRVKRLTQPVSHLRTLGPAQSCGYNTPRETPHLHR